MQLSRGRTSGFTANPLTWTDLDAWSRLTATRPTAFEVGLIHDIDACLLTVVRESKPKK